MATLTKQHWNGWYLNQVYHCYGDLPEQEGDYRVCHHCHCLFPINALGVRTRSNKITCSNKCRVARSRARRMGDGPLVQ